jgi:hypothetical protein
VLLLGAALAITACGRSDGAPKQREPSLTPEAVARAYVEALNRRDGKRFCELVAPYISGGYDLVTRDPDWPAGARAGHHELDRRAQLTVGAESGSLSTPA